MTGQPHRAQVRRGQAVPVSEYDVIVVGLGAMGSSAAYHLGRRGLRVLGIEQFTPAHPLGSSHGGSRIVRKAYFENPSYVPLLVRSYELWDELSATFGAELITRCGSLMIGEPDSRVVIGALESARRWSLPHELLDAGRMRERFPQFSLPPGQVAVHELDAGFVRPEASILASLELAAETGAELWFDTAVESVELGPGGVYLSTADEQVQAPRVVLATGAWAGRLANLDRYPLSVQRQSVHWFRPLSPVTDYGPDRFPVYVWAWPVPAGQERVELYGFPYLDGEIGIKAALYHDGRNPDVDPDALDRVVIELDHAPVSELLRRGVPGVAGELVDSSICMYPSSSDDDFVLGFHPGSSGRVVLAAGFGGHGFKFMPVVGEIVADLVIDGASRLDIGFLSPERFATRR